MNDDVNQQILTELRKLRQINQMMSIVSIVALLTVLAFYGWYRVHSYPSLRQSPETQSESWETVRSAVAHLEYDRAESIAQRLVKRYPNDYYGYVYLGNIALAKDNVKGAEGYYERADELFPTEEHDKMLAAVRKRLNKEESTPATSTH